MSLFSFFVVLLLLCLAFQPPVEPLRPKSRAELHRAQLANEHKQAQDQVLKEKAKELHKAAAERATIWREERQRMREEYLTKQAVSHGFDPNSGVGNIGDPLDCFNVPGGTAQRDLCGICGGDDSSCSDCAGVPNGEAEEDCAGVCQGNDVSCEDCSGTQNGELVEDSCGVCGGDGSTCRDCAGVLQGTSVVDECGVCGGDSTSCVDCHGVPNGPDQNDPCGVCGGDGHTCCSNVDAVVYANTENDAIVVLCSGHGSCSADHGFCLCDQGFTGPFCSARQNLCLALEGRLGTMDLCSGRGTCDPDTGTCSCNDPDTWMGPECEFNRCMYRGAYNVMAEECQCIHGYGGQYCDRCAASHPEFGKVHVCMEMKKGWQAVPEDLWLSSSILLGEKHPVAPVFTLIDVDQAKAQSYVWGHALINVIETSRWNNDLRRDVIWPNSTHKASGYYYDCGCRLATPPPLVHDDGGADDGDTNTTVVIEAKLEARSYRPRFIPVPRTDKAHEALAMSSRTEARKTWLRGLSVRAPATFSQCQGFLDDVLDEFGFNINVATAEVSEVAAAVEQVNDECGGEVAFVVTWFLVGLLILILVGGAVMTVLWAVKKYAKKQTELL